MTLPNAHKGVKKLFIAEILLLIGAALLLFGAIFLGAAVVEYVNMSEGAAGGLALGASISLFGGLVLPIIGYILSLVGLKQASKDEPDYMAKAFTSAICALILAILSGVAESFGWGIAGFLNFLQNVADLCVFVFSIMGVSEVTQNIARQDVADMGPTILKIVVIVYVLSFIASLFGAIIGGAAALIASGLLLVAYVAYLVFLGRATSALAQG